MKNPEDLYNSLMAMKSLKGLTVDESIDEIAKLVDISNLMQKAEGLERALQLLDTLNKRKLTRRQKILYHYYLGNIYEPLERIQKGYISQASSDWEQNGVEKTILMISPSFSRHLVRPHFLTP